MSLFLTLSSLFIIAFGDQRERKWPIFLFIQGFSLFLFDKRSQRKLSWEIVLLFTSILLFSAKVGQFSPWCCFFYCLVFFFFFFPLFFNIWDTPSDAKSHQFSLKWTAFGGNVSFQTNMRNTFCHIIYVSQNTFWVSQLWFV